MTLLRISFVFPLETPWFSTWLDQEPQLLTFQSKKPIVHYFYNFVCTIETSHLATEKIQALLGTSWLRNYLYHCDNASAVDIHIPDAYQFIIMNLLSRLNCPLRCHNCIYGDFVIDLHIFYYSHDFPTQPISCSSNMSVVWIVSDILIRVDRFETFCHISLCLGSDS
jgi:hypothetical protein